jgi:hypothetical protein
MGWLVILISGFLPLAAMLLVDPWPWPNSYLITYVVVMGIAWLVRIVSVYKLAVSPRAAHYRALARGNWGRGGMFVVFFTTVFLIIFTFATFYWALSGRSVSAFAEPLSRIDAVYFAVTVFTTTGFGDIHATSDLARFAVTLQMFFGFAFVVGAVGVALSKPPSPGADARHRSSTDGSGAEHPSESAQNPRESENTRDVA